MWLWILTFIPLFADDITLRLDHYYASSSAMGRSSTAQPYDEYRILQNPSGLGHFLSYMKNPVIFSPVNISLQSQRLLIASKGNLGIVAKQITNSPIGDYQYQSLSYFPFIAYHSKHRETNLLLGLPTVAHIDLYKKESGLEVHQVKNATFLMSWATMNSSGSASFGMNLRPQIQVESIDSTLSLNKVLLNGTVTSAVTADVGVLFSALDYWIPTLGISLKNPPLQCVTYNNTLNKLCGAPHVLISGTPESLLSTLEPTELRAGISITPRIHLSHSRLNFRISGDVFPIPIKVGSNLYGIPMKHLDNLFHYGLEISSGNPRQPKPYTSLRIGSDENRLTFGLSLALGNSLSLEYSCLRPKIVSESVHTLTLTYL